VWESPCSWGSSSLRLPFVRFFEFDSIS
jgi:hypothetical protein